jgi:hypothetical protein
VSALDAQELQLAIQAALLWNALVGPALWAVPVSLGGVGAAVLPERVWAAALARSAARAGVGPDRYCPLRHPTHSKPSVPELDGILRRGKQYMPSPLPATSSKAFSTLIYLVGWHPMTWRATSTRPYTEPEAVAAAAAAALPLGWVVVGCGAVLGACGRAISVFGTLTGPASPHLPLCSPGWLFIVVSAFEVLLTGCIAACNNFPVCHAVTTAETMHSSTPNLNLRHFWSLNTDITRCIP